MSEKPSSRCSACHRKHTKQTYILACVIEHGPVSAIDIESITGIPTAHVYTEFHRLLREDLIEHAGFTYYSHRRTRLYAATSKVRGFAAERQAS